MIVIGANLNHPKMNASMSNRKFTVATFKTVEVANKGYMT